MNKEKIRKQLQEWWNDSSCFCEKDYCDLCANCFKKLCNIFGFELVGGLNIKHKNESSK